MTCIAKGNPELNGDKEHLWECYIHITDDEGFKIREYFVDKCVGCGKIIVGNEKSAMNGKQMYPKKVEVYYE